MNKQISKLTDVLALLVFGAFALSVLLALLISAGAYRDLTADAQAQFDRRTALRYITTRVHQAQSVTVEPFGDGPALVMREELDSGTYLIRIYHHEGMLRELYCEASASLRPEDGEPILEADALDFSLEGRILTVVLGTDRLVLYIPEGAEVGT